MNTIAIAQELLVQRDYRAPAAARQRAAANIADTIRSLDWIDIVRAVLEILSAPYDAQRVDVVWVLCTAAGKRLYALPKSQLGPIQATADQFVRSVLSLQSTPSGTEYAQHVHCRRAVAAAAVAAAAVADLTVLLLQHAAEHLPAAAFWGDVVLEVATAVQPGTRVASWAKVAARSALHGHVHVLCSALLTLPAEHAAASDLLHVVGTLVSAAGVPCSALPSEACPRLAVLALSPEHALASSAALRSLADIFGSPTAARAGVPGGLQALSDLLAALPSLLDAAGQLRWADMAAVADYVAVLRAAWGSIARTFTTAEQASAFLQTVWQLTQALSQAAFAGDDEAGSALGAVLGLWEAVVSFIAEQPPGSAELYTGAVQQVALALLPSLLWQSNADALQCLNEVDAASAAAAAAAVSQAPAMPSWCTLPLLAGRAQAVIAACTSDGGDAGVGAADTALSWAQQQRASYDTAADAWIGQGCAILAGVAALPGCGMPVLQQVLGALDGVLPGCQAVLQAPAGGHAALELRGTHGATDARTLCQLLGASAPSLLQGSGEHVLSLARIVCCVLRAAAAAHGAGVPSAPVFISAALDLWAVTTRCAQDSAAWCTADDGAVLLLGAAAAMQACTPAASGASGTSPVPASTYASVARMLELVASALASDSPLQRQVLGSAQLHTALLELLGAATARSVPLEAACACAGPGARIVLRLQDAGVLSAGQAQGMVEQLLAADAAQLGQLLMADPATTATLLSSRRGRTYATPFRRSCALAAALAMALRAEPSQLRNVGMSWGYVPIARAACAALPSLCDPSAGVWQAWTPRSRPGSAAAASRALPPVTALLLARDALLCIAQGMAAAGMSTLGEKSATVQGFTTAAHALRLAAGWLVPAIAQREASASAAALAYAAGQLLVTGADHAALISPVLSVVLGGGQAETDPASYSVLTVLARSPWLAAFGSAWEEPGTAAHISVVHAAVLTLLGVLQAGWRGWCKGSAGALGLAQELTQPRIALLCLGTLLLVCGPIDTYAQYHLFIGSAIVRAEELLHWMHQPSLSSDLIPLAAKAVSGWLETQPTGDAQQVSLKLVAQLLCASAVPAQGVDWGVRLLGLDEQGQAVLLRAVDSSSGKLVVTARMLQEAIAAGAEAGRRD